MKLSISIVIPNFNGLEQLETHLPSVIKHSQGAQVIIVDDASTDDSVEYLKTHYPNIKVIAKTKNHGFASTVNTGFEVAKTDLVLLLNNDVSLHKNTITTLAQNFDGKENLFGVGAKELLPDGGERGRSWGQLQRGLLVHGPAQLVAGPTLWVFGASGMFNRKVWHKLGGMDELYSPAYWEDIDVSYRAWKSGYECWFDPQATLEHQGEMSMNKALGSKKTALVFRNQLLFFWKNIDAPRWWLQHVLWLPYHLLVTNLKTKGAFLSGFMMALVRIAKIKPNLLEKLRSDDEIVVSVQN